MRLALADIEENGGTQSRAQRNDEKIREYSEILEQLPPVIVFYDGAKYWLADGFHRVAAALNIEARDIAADVRQGTQRDAVFFSFGANASHGIPRSNDDKRRAVERMLADAEWGTWSDRQIAEACRVSHTLVATIRRPRGNSATRESGNSATATTESARTGGRVATAETGNVATLAGNSASPSRPPPDLRLAALTRIEVAVDALHDAVRDGMAVPGVVVLLPDALADHQRWLTKALRA